LKHPYGGRGFNKWATNKKTAARGKTLQKRQRLQKKQRLRFLLITSGLVTVWALTALPVVVWSQESEEGWMTISQINALPYKAPATGAGSSGVARAGDVVTSSSPFVPPALSGSAAATSQSAMNGAAINGERARVRDEDIYLDVTLNGEAREDMYPFQQLPSGSLIIRVDDLRSIGLLPVKAATDREGFVDLDRLPNVTYLIRDGNIVDFITTDAAALAPYAIALSGWANAANLAPLDADMRAQSDLTGVLNYSFYADTGGKEFGRIKHLNGISGMLEGRISGKFGTVFTSQLLSYRPDYHDKFETIRLESYWNYSDEERMLTYQAGDVITRSLPWSRSTRMGGFQLRRNFSLREDLLTTPMPSITGSAALPSTVDVYINNAQVATHDVPAGPYSLTNMPIISGANNARIIVRDATGRETVTNMDFFSHSDLLAKGLLDFSFEAGMPRRNFGIKSADYSGDFMVSATARYGLSDRITLEGHAEAGKDFFNAGIGSTLSIADIGAVSLAGSTSAYRSANGQQLYAGVQLQKWGFHFNARTQRSYGDYHDMASIVDARARRNDTDRMRARFGFVSNYDRYGAVRPPKAINQLSLSTNLRFDPTTISAAYTEIDHFHREDSRFLSISASRIFVPRVYAYANAYLDLKNSKGYGIFAGLSVNFDNNISASVNSTTNHRGTSVTSQLTRSMGSKVGDYGLSVRDTEGQQTQRGVEGRYRAKFATVAASVEQYNQDSWRATAQADGALVFADGSVTPAQRLHNSFAVVNAGMGGVGIYANNSYFDKTWRNGRLVVPDLYAHRTSTIKLDMETLPVDALVESTEIKLRPRERSGVIVNFGASADSYAYVALTDAQGRPIETGSYAQIEGSDLGFDVGYDGMGILPLEGVKLPARLQVQVGDNRACQAVVPANINRGVSAGTQTLRCE